MKLTEKQKRAIELDNSRQFYTYKDSTPLSRRYAPIAEFIYEERKNQPAEATYKRKTGDRFRSDQIRALTILLRNLHNAHKRDPDKLVALPKRAGTVTSDLDGVSLGSTVRNTAYSTLVDLGYVELIAPGYKPKKGKGKRTKIKPTDKLIALINSQLGESVTDEELANEAVEEELIALGDVLELRSSKAMTGIPQDDEKAGDAVLFTETPRTTAMRSDVLAYNELLQKHHIDIPLAAVSKSKNTITITLNRKNYHRVFNNSSWECGGRYYRPWWVNAPSELRPLICINSKPTVEIDYKAIHPTLAYSLEGIPYSHDPYEISGYKPSGADRSLIKTALLIMFNAADRNSARKAIQSKVNGGELTLPYGKDVNQLLDDITNHHKSISSYFFSNKGLSLQYQDSQLATEIIGRFVDRDKAVLSVHDSFIVNADEERQLAGEMNQTLQNHITEMGTLPSGAKVELILKVTEYQLRGPNTTSRILEGEEAETIAATIAERGVADVDLDERYSGWQESNTQYETLKVEADNSTVGIKYNENIEIRDRPVSYEFEYIPKLITLN